MRTLAAPLFVIASLAPLAQAQVSDQPDPEIVLALLQSEDDPKVSMRASLEVVVNGRHCVAAISSALPSLSEGSRWQVLFPLTRMGAAAEGSVPVLITLIEEQPFACRALGAIGPAALASVGPLGKLLADPDAKKVCRSEAAIALGRLAGGSREVRVALRAALREGGVLSIGALEGLYWAEPDLSLIPELKRYLRHKRSRARREAVRVTARLCPVAPDEVLPLLEKALRDEDKRVRSEAARQLCYLGWRAVPALEGLQKAQFDPALEVRQWATLALGEAAAEGVPALLKAAEGEDRAIRLLSIRVLGRMGPRGRRALPLLSRALTGSDWYARREAIEALAGLGKFAEPASAKLLGVALGTLGLKPVQPEMSTGPAAPFEARIRLAALRALERIGPKKAAKSVLPSLKTLSAGEPSEQGAWAVWLRAELGGEEPNLQFLDRCLLSPRSDVRAAAAEVLGRLGQRARGSAKSLVQCARVAEGREEMWVAFAIGRLSRRFDPLPTLREGALSANPATRRAALQALGALGPEAAPAMPEVFKAAVWSETEAYATLTKIGPSAERAVEFLIQTALTGSPRESLLARRTLRDLGKTVPALGLEAPR